MLTELKPDLSGIKPGGVNKVVIEHVNALFGADQGGLGGEGSQLIKINGRWNPSRSQGEGQANGGSITPDFYENGVYSSFLYPGVNIMRVRNGKIVEGLGYVKGG